MAYDNDYEFLDEDYDQDYVDAMNDFTKGLDEDSKEMLHGELEKISYDPTDNARQDAELNLLRAEKRLAQMNRKLGAAFDSYASFIAREDGMSKAAVRRMVHKAMKDEG